MKKYLAILILTHIAWCMPSAASATDEQLSISATTSEISSEAELRSQICSKGLLGPSAVSLQDFHSLARSRTWTGWFYAKARSILGRRYAVEVEGLNEITVKGNSQILFLFEHPSMMDAAILYSVIGDAFHTPRPVVSEKQNHGLTKRAYNRVNAFVVPTSSSGAVEKAQRVEELNGEILAELARGGNVAIAPAGQIKHTHLDDLRNKRMAADLIRNLPEGARVVLVPLKGLFGSSFSYGATGSAPKGPALTGELIYLALRNKLQRRKVEMSFRELTVDELTWLKTQDRAVINTFTSDILNAQESPNTYVPLSCNQAACTLPDPLPEGSKSPTESKALAAAAGKIPSELRRKTVEALVERMPERAAAIHEAFAEQPLAGIQGTFAELLGIDSLGYLELVQHLEQRLGIALADYQGNTPHELLLNIYRSSLVSETPGGAVAAATKRPDLRWFRYHEGPETLKIGTGENIMASLFNKARENPEAPWMADPTSGVITYREGVAKIMIIARTIRQMRGQNIGVMLPSSVGGTLMYFAALLAGKTPTMVNYTAKSEYILYSMNETKVQTVITSRLFVEKLGQKGLTVDSIQDRFVFAEDLLESMQERSLSNAFDLAMNLLQRERGRFTSLWPNGKGVQPDDPAVILFTSGSSKRPKPVLLTHKNIMTNIAAVAPIFNLKRADTVTGFAPFFHSLGLTDTLVMPALLGARVHYFPDATDAHGIADSVAMHKSSMIVGPPKLLQQIFIAARPEQLDSLRYVLTGAAALLPNTAKILTENARNAVVLEGAGTTEASPVWAVTPPNHRRSGWVGPIIVPHEVADHDSLNAAIAASDPSLIEFVAPDANGIRDGELLLTGPSVITEYYGGIVPEAFIKIGDQTYFRTNDHVQVDVRDRNNAKIIGRFDREHKTPGGEKISHEMIESELNQVAEFQAGADGKDRVYVGVTTLANGEKVTTLVTSSDTDVDTVNRALGKVFSATMFVGKVVRVSQIPFLGTGKVDRQACDKIIEAAASAETATPY